MISARLGAFVLTALGAALLFAFALHSSSHVSAATELELDSYRANNSQAKTVGPVLDNGRQYIVTITGTFSYWPASQWVNHGVCVGTAEDMPMFPSPGTTNGKVGVDAAWHFAAPGDASDCSDTYPRVAHVTYSLDGGTTTNEYLADDVGSAPKTSHQYHYTVVGQGQTIVFVINDNKTTDNYGILKISIEAASTPTPSPTASPTPSPSPVQQTKKWGDNNCDDNIDGEDVMLAFQYIISPDDVAQIPNCPNMGQTITVLSTHPSAFPPLTWGNTHCGDAIDGMDPLDILRHMAGFDAVPLSGFCPGVGDEVVFERAP